MIQNSQPATLANSVTLSASTAEAVVLLTPLKSDDQLGPTVLVDSQLVVDWLAELDGRVGVTSSWRVPADVTGPIASCAPPPSSSYGGSFICAAETIFHPFWPMRG
jgi:hypothetical protein